MGIFGGKQQPDPMQSDDLVSNVPIDEAPGQTASIDGMLPNGPAHQPQQDDPLSTTAPIVDDHVHDDGVGEYIMAESPAPHNSKDEASPPNSAQPVLDVNSPELAKHAVIDMPEEETNEPEVPQYPATDNGPSFEDLSTIKQQALKQLSPLVNHLEQTPEEKFQTTMMMLQATDDHSLVKAAYEAAQAITDEKARAQALLEVVNEINYFTQNIQNK